jgi:FkbM family methyltransferase
MFYSEHGQDKWLEENVFMGRKGGTFVEIGALDGKTCSNTLYFQESMGWGGILVEPNPIQYENLRKNRSQTDPRVMCYNIGVGQDYEILKFSYIKGCPGWSGFSKFFEPEHVQRIDTLENKDIETFDISIVPLHETIVNSHIEKIDYLSLDVEGMERHILEHFDFNCCDIEIFDVEDNWGNNSVLDIMIKNGYQKIARLGVNDIYRKHP